MLGPAGHRFHATPPLIPDTKKKNDGHRFLLYAAAGVLSSSSRLLASLFLPRQAPPIPIADCCLSCLPLPSVRSSGNFFDAGT
ncbi:unnamed protein product [Urochloa humidicola]